MPCGVRRGFFLQYQEPVLENGTVLEDMQMLRWSKEETEMDFMNTPEQFAHIPKDILRDRRITLAAKGLYSVICTFGPDSPVSITAVAELLGLPVEEIDPIWDEMVSFMRLKEKEEELFRAMAEMQQELGGSQN